jgi:hypothetical protein
VSWQSRTMLTKVLKRGSLFLLLVVAICESISAQDKPKLSTTDRTRLAETFRLAQSVGDTFWPGWTKAPLAVLLVTPDYEFLMRHPTPSPDFLPLGYDPLLKSKVSYRKRTLATHLLATYPVISGSGVSTIVVGQAEQTSAKTSTPWVITLLHEHFHQLQSSQPNYYADVATLNLSGGDQSGMWMLNFPFPYEKPAVQESFRELSKLLVEAIQAPRSNLNRRVACYLRARARFQELLTPDEAKYFEFQLWQEGIARYTELEVSKLAASRFKPSRDFRALPDYTTFSQTADSIRARIFKQLEAPNLGESGRTLFYPFGAAEALLLDRVNPNWKSRYLVRKFELNSYYPARLQ